MFGLLSGASIADPVLGKLKYTKGRWRGTDCGADWRVGAFKHGGLDTSTPAAECAVAGRPTAPGASPGE